LVEPGGLGKEIALRKTRFLRSELLCARPGSLGSRFKQESDSFLWSAMYDALDAINFVAIRLTSVPTGTSRAVS
jgi:hypothetical protein